MRSESSSPRRRPGFGGLFAAPEFYRERTTEPIGLFEAVFEPSVLVLAIVLFSQGIVQLGRVIAPRWNVDGLLLMCGLAAVAGYLYSRRLARGTVIWREWLVLLAPMVFVSRFVPYLTEPGGDLVGDVRIWLADPGSFVEPGWIIRAAVIIGAWATAFYSTQDLNQIRLQRGELPSGPARTLIERAWEGERARSIDHTWPLQRLASRFLTGGVALIVFAALTSTAQAQTLDIDVFVELVLLARPSSAAALANVVAYFVAVLLLLIEAQYVRNRTLWTLDRVQIAETVASRWAATGLLVVAVGLVAALLAPTEGLLGLGEIVRVALSLLFFVASYLIVAAYLLFWLITYPLRLLVGSAPDDPGPLSRPSPPPVIPPTEGGSPLLEVIKSALFWSIVGGVVLYSLWALWRERQHGRLGAALRLVDRLGAGVWRLLALLAALLRRGASVVGDVARRLVPAGAAASAARRARAWAIGALPGRDPRRVVLALYALMAARAAERGLERRTGQTALEYGSKLREGLPDVSGEVEGLTGAFLRARYSRQEIRDEDAGLARRSWSRIRGRLRRVRGVG
ncbi:MAG TPA: DUF4129 domain-containing protein [Chloroflexota bacterium]|nr:DUF4129 domain-containing protein [Chloroflexota bacterium]